MSVHESFWVATATAAPVIALSAIISVNDLVKQGIKIGPGDVWGHYKGAANTVYRLMIASFLVTILNGIMQIFVLYYSLQSLAKEHDDDSTLFIITITILGFILIFVNILLSGVARMTMALSADEINQQRKYHEARLQGKTYVQDTDSNIKDNQSKEESP